MLSRLVFDRPRRLSHAEMERAWQRQLWWYRYGVWVGLIVTLASGGLGWWMIAVMLGRW